MQVKLSAKILISAMCFPLLLSGCSAVKSMDRTEITYNGKTYALVSPYWEMVDCDSYEVKTVSSDGESLNIRIYDNSDSFIYCENDSLLYYDESEALPNVTEDIDYLTVEDIDGDGSTAQKYDAEELLTIISSAASSGVSGNNKATVMLYYKDFPACYFYGSIVVDEDNNYWLYSEDSEDYKTISRDSAILSSVL